MNLHRISDSISGRIVGTDDGKAFVMLDVRTYERLMKRIEKLEKQYDGLEKKYTELKSGE